MAIADLPGYVQGFVFSDASSATYESGVFKNQSPYGPGPGGIADITLTVGTPSFATTNGQKGVILDNTVQGNFVPALPWECAVITVMKPNMTTNTSIYPVILGGSASISSNGRIYITRTPSIRHGITTPSSQSIGQEDYGSLAGSSDMKVTAFEQSQETRRSYSTRDGVTVTASAALADAGNGLGLAWGSTGGAAGGVRARFGNISGTIGDTAASVNPMELYELHFFKPGLLRDAGSLALLAAEMAALKTKYGL